MTAGIGSDRTELQAAMDRGVTVVLRDAADRTGQGRLRHMAGLGRPAEVLLAGQRDQVAQLADEHVTRRPG